MSERLVFLLQTRVCGKQKKEVTRLIKKSETYASEAHFVRCAVFEKLQREAEQ